MIVDRISYKKIFPIGSYANETIGLEAEVDVGDDIIDCYKQLKIMAEKFHKDNNPQLAEAGTVNWVTERGMESLAETIPYPYTHSLSPKASIPTIDPRAYEKVEIGIDNAKTIGELEFYGELSEKYGLSEQYLSKLKSLQ